MFGSGFFLFFMLGFFFSFLAKILVFLNNYSIVFQKKASIGRQPDLNVGEIFETFLDFLVFFQNVPSQI